MADVAVVGAGPAGLAAAVSAAEAGARVVLVDAAPQPGGQYWRHADETAHPDPDGAGQHHWRTFRDLRERLRAAEREGRLEYRHSTTVWLAERAGEQFVLRTVPSEGAAGGPERPPGAPTVAPAAPGRVHAGRVVLCPGAYDRQLPVPGWDLPGVVTAGGAQALLKAHGVRVGRRVVVAGTGPFLLAVAAGLAEAGAEVVALCEAAHPAGWLSHPGAVARQGPKLLQGAGYLAGLARHGVRPRSRTVVTEVLGTDHVTGVRLSRVDAAGRLVGAPRTVAADAVALGWGFTPQVELPLMLGAQPATGNAETLVVRVDADQRTSVPGLYVAGEATGVGGAALAVAEGRVAGTAAAGAQPAARDRREVLRQRAFARAMHAVHRVPEHWPDWLTDDTVVCRCEEVSAGTVRTALTELGATDPRSLRSVTRVGMGRCQGRVCGWAAACLLAATSGRDLTTEDLLPGSARPLAAHVTLGALAAVDETPAGATPAPLAPAPLAPRPTEETAR